VHYCIATIATTGLILSLAFALIQKDSKNIKLYGYSCPIQQIAVAVAVKGLTYKPIVGALLVWWYLTTNNSTN